MATRTTKGTEGVETPSLNELLKQLLDKNGAAPPPGWFTSKHLQAEWGVGERQCNKILSRLLSAGLMQRRKFVAKVGQGKSQSIWHYAKTSI